ncbi:MAG: cobalamin biosynthesis protein [Pseudomonadota bacterium]
MIVAGFGFTSSATAASLENALAATGYSDQITLLAAPADKTMAAPMVALSRARKLIVTSIDALQLKATKTRTQSATSQRARGTGSVAEAAALAAAGPGARLIASRHISDDRMATCAIAKGGDT